MAEHVRARKFNNVLIVTINLYQNTKTRQSLEPPNTAVEEEEEEGVTHLCSDIMFYLHTH